MKKPEGIDASTQALEDPEGEDSKKTVDDFMIESKELELYLETTQVTADST